MSYAVTSRAWPAGRGPLRRPRRRAATPPGALACRDVVDFGGDSRHVAAGRVEVAEQRVEDLDGPRRLRGVGVLDEAVVEVVRDRPVVGQQPAAATTFSAGTPVIRATTAGGYAAAIDASRSNTGRQVTSRPSARQARHVPRRANGASAAYVPREGS